MWWEMGMIISVTVFWSSKHKGLKFCLWILLKLLCVIQTMWHSTGEGFRWYCYGKGRLVSLLMTFASQMTGKTSSSGWDLHWQVGFYCFSWSWYFLVFQEAFGNKTHVSFRNIAFQRDLTSPVQWGKHEFSGIKEILLLDFKDCVDLLQWFDLYILIFSVEVWL